MQNEGLVSVIVPIYNVEKYLERCLHSIVKQTYSQLEIILVDDGSQDSCGDLCDRWAAVDNRIKVIHKANGGLGFARNSGLDAAMGTFVAFIDSDDYISEDYFAKYVHQMVLHEADMVVGGIIRKNNNGSESRKLAAEKITVVENNSVIRDVLLPVIGAEPTAKSDVEREMSVCCNLYRKSLIDQLALRFVSEREYVSEDLFFNLIYALNVQRAVLIPDCLYNYCENEVSLTHTYRPDRFEKYCKMFERQEEILKENHLYERAKLRLYRTFIMKTKKCISLLAYSDLPYSEKKKKCEVILEAPLLQRVVQEYSNVGHLSLKYRFILFCMKNGKYNVLLFYYALLSKRR